MRSGHDPLDATPAYDPAADSRLQAASERLRETPLEKESVFEGRFLTVRRDTARLPDGGTSTREFVVHPGASAMLVLDVEGRVLVERQFRYPMGRVYVELPAGKRDQGESFLQTARRELVEETGYAGREWAHLTTIHTAIGFTDEEIAIYLVRDLVRKRQSLDFEEFLEIDWMTVDELLDLVDRGLLPDVKTQIAILHLERMMSGRRPWPTFQRLGDD